MLLLSLGLSSFDQFVSGLAMGRPRRESTRYFSKELMVPPLDPLDDGPLSSSSCDCDSSNPLSVLYTNDPRSVSQWLAEHVDPRGCVLGFDVEVRLSVCRMGGESFTELLSMER